MHLHLVQFQILDRDGFTKGPGGQIIPNGSPQLPPAEEAGWRTRRWSARTRSSE